MQNPYSYKKFQWIITVRPRISTQAECEVVDCGSLAIAHGDLGGQTTFGGALSFTCDSGYYDPVDNRPLQCLISGRYNRTPRCEPRHCGRPQVQQATCALEEERISR
jgi:hypothetical protein